MGGVVLGGAAALGAFAAAGFEAAKALGEYGTHIKDVELRTGFTAKEVGQFGFAARVAGQDVSIFERMMKGLSQAADDTSKEGEKARATMQRLGVTMYDTTGAMKPTSQILEGIAEGLSRMPNALERDAAAMALFKKIGVESIPVVMELAENLKIARENGYGPNNEQVESFRAYQREVVQAEMAWAKMKRSFQVPLAATIEFLFNGMKWVEFAASLPGKLLMGQLFNGTQKPVEAEMAETQGWGYGGSMSRSAHAGEKRSLATNDAMVAAARVSDQGNKQIELAEKKLSELQGELKLGVAPSVNSKVLGEIGQQRGVIAGIKAATEAAKQLKEFRTQAAVFERRGDEAELDATGKIYFQRDLLLKQAGHLKGVEGDIAKIRKSADEQASVVFKKDWAEFEKSDQKRSADLQKRSLEMYEPSKGQMKEWSEGFAAQDQIDSINLQSRRDTINRNAGHAGRMVELGGATGMDAIRATYQIRIELANQLAAVEAERILKQTNGAQQLVEGARALKELNKQIAEAQEEALMKQLELQKQQMDTLKRESEGLWNTLLTKPGNFGRQLGETIHAAVLKPITEGLAGMTANVLKPIIYGSDGQGGLAGIFKGAFGGGHQDPMKMSTDLNTAVTSQNSAAMAMLTAVMAGAMGMAGPAVAMPVGIGGISLPSISAPAGGFSSAAGGAGGFGGFGSGTVAGAGGGGSPLSGILGIGRGGFGGILSGLKSAVGLGNIGTDSGGGRWAQVGNQSIALDGVGGYANAIGRSPAFGAAGSMLAMQGLMGSSRGTWGGVGMGAAGGSMVGFQMGGPLGALIGGAAGGLIGLGEKIAGVETPEREAIRLVKQIYSLNIDNATAKQIAGIAKQSYGGHVSSAVRSPEVRQLLQLVAESTGQKSNLYLNDPHGVNLTQAGGRLNQTAFYNNGTPNTYQSSLNVMGPAGSTVPSGNPYGGGGGNIILNVNGQSAADLLEGRAGSYIADNPRQVSGASLSGMVRDKWASMALAPDAVSY